MGWGFTLSSARRNREYVQSSTVHRAWQHFCCLALHLPQLSQGLCQRLGRGTASTAASHCGCQVRWSDWQAGTATPHKQCPVALFPSPRREQFHHAAEARIGTAGLDLILAETGAPSAGSSRKHSSQQLPETAGAVLRNRLSGSRGCGACSGPA